MSEEDSKQADNEWISWRAPRWLLFCPHTTNPHRNADTNHRGESDKVALLLGGLDVLSPGIEANRGPAFTLNMFWVFSMKSWGFFPQITVFQQARGRWLFDLWQQQISLSILLKIQVFFKKQGFNLMEDGSLCSESPEELSGKLQNKLSSSISNCYKNQRRYLLSSSSTPTTDISV